MRACGKAHGIRQAGVQAVEDRGKYVHTQLAMPGLQRLPGEGPVQAGGRVMPDWADATPNKSFRELARRILPLFELPDDPIGYEAVEMMRPMVESHGGAHLRAYLADINEEPELLFLRAMTWVRTTLAEAGGEMVKMKGQEPARPAVQPGGWPPGRCPSSWGPGGSTLHRSVPASGTTTYRHRESAIHVYRTGPRRTTPDHTRPRRTTPDHAGPLRTTPGHTIPHRTTLDHTGPHRTTPDILSDRETYRQVRPGQAGTGQDRPGQ